jgi:hypothetical protein
MKKALLNLFALLFISAAGFSQAVVINSPPSLAGVYTYGTAQFGPDLTSDVWCGDAVVIKDASSNPTLGCDPNILNAADLVGKFVLIDRGTCNFSLKAYNGQLAGAKACIIFNNVPGAGVQGMGAGSNGADVTIPTVMLSYEDGVKIKAAIAGGATVNFCLGNIRFPNDLSTNNRAGICHAPFGSFPLAWLRADDDFVITPGASVTNKGQNLGTGVKLNAKISYTPNGGSSTQFYNKTSDPGITVEVDSTNDIILESKSILGFADKVGKGSIAYTITSDSSEAAIADNTAVSEFYLTNNIFSKARLAANGRDPFITTSYRRSDGTNAEYISGYTIPYCKDCKLDTILFNMAVSSPSILGGLVAEANLYGWNDANGDGDATNDELSYLALGTYTFDAADTRTSAIARVPIQDFNTGNDGFTIPDNNFGVFIGVRYSGPETPFFGFDEGIDYLCDNTVKTNAGTLRIDDLPYLGITGYDPNTGVPDIDNASFRFTGLSAPLAASMVFSNLKVDSKQLTDQEAQIKLYPNPVKDKFVVDLVLNETNSKVIYEVLDNSGKIIFQSVDKNPGKEFKARFNVQNLSNGLYHLLVRTDKGFKQASFEVVK